MTLRFFNNQGKLDTRQIEYDQAMVRLGLEKATLEREVDRERQKVVEAQKQRDEMLKEIVRLEGVAKEWDLRRVEIQKQIQDSIAGGAIQSATLKKHLEKGDATIKAKKENIDQLNVLLENLDKEIAEKLSRIKEIDSEIPKKHAELTGVRSELSQVKREFEEAQSDFKDMALLKVRANKELTDAIIEKNEIEEQVKILQINNRAGLDALTSLEGERRRLKEKEEFLVQKEADLLVYENRLKKYCIKVGYNVEMVFK